MAPRLQSSALTDASPAARAARCDYTAPHMQSAETACAVFLEAGYTCASTWSEICGIDHPDGAEYNSNTLKMAGCPDSCCSQCATEEPGSGAYASGEVDGASVRAFDPEGMEEAKKVLDGVTWCEDTYDAIKGSDAVAIVTEWNEFRSLDFARMKELMRSPILVDLRNIYEPEHVTATGFSYSCVGRPAPNAAE